MSSSRPGRQADAELRTPAYRRRRAGILAMAVVCGICAEQECPHCHGEKPHCGSRLGTLDHDIARSKGGPMSAENEQASHACCNLKKGDRGGAPEILRTSKNW